MSKRRQRLPFKLAGLFAVGAIPAAVSDDTPADVDNSKNSLLDQIKGVVINIDEQQTYTLAQHRSHSSHGSHGSHSSHSSHRSSSIRPFSASSADGPETKEESALLVTTGKSNRNESSTPRSAVLPISPAITEPKPKKVKILPGNAGKFKETVMRVQIALLSEGYAVGEINGELHARAIAAIHQYQADAGLLPSGKLTPETLGSLGIVVQ